VKPITVRDLYYRNEQIVTTPSSSRFISGLVDAQPPTGATARAAGHSRPDIAALSAPARQLDDPAPARPPRRIRGNSCMQGRGFESHQPL